jgi:RNA polymerase sigma-70 factor (ECF subfamily)
MAAAEDEIHRLFRTHGAAVRRWARRFARFPSDADDIAQEVFLVLHRRTDVLRHLGSPGRWLLRTTVNVAQHFRRTQIRQTTRDVSWELASRGGSPTDPLAELEAREIAQGISEVLETLDERSAQIYRLSELERMSTTAISALMGISPDTVRVRRFRTRRAIAHRLAVFYPFEGSSNLAECRYDADQAEPRSGSWARRSQHASVAKR